MRSVSKADQPDDRTMSYDNGTCPYLLTKLGVSDTGAVPDRG